MRKVIISFIFGTLATVAAADARFVAAEGGTAIVAGPGTIYTTEGHLPFGARVDVRERYQGYALILLPSGVEAWVRDSALRARLPQPVAPTPANVEMVEQPYASVVWTQGGKLNLRAGPGVQHQVLDKCLKGDWVEVVAHSGGWSKVRLADGAEGWVSSRYLTR
jgi:uncharacterized protein YgiM (DUF1202 family)